MSQQTLPLIEINPSSLVQATVICLHGLGADGNDFSDIVPLLKLPDELGIRFIFPNAPIRPITLNNGFPMRAWFDIISLSPNGPVDKQGLLDSEQILDTLIQHEIDAGIPTSKILLAGFSQGGAIALHYGLNYPQKHAGIIALSTFLPDSYTIPAHADPLPIFVGHGKNDPIISYQWAEHSKNKLAHLGHQISWHSYPMDHSVSPEEMLDVSQWLQNVLKINHSVVEI